MLAQMINSGVGLESIDFLLAKARKADKANIVEVVEKDMSENVKDKRRCKWWNRGYCWEKEGCSFLHPKEDCQDHLHGRCNIKGCTLRHRRQCKFHCTEVGCKRGNMCAYIHGKVLKEKDVLEICGEIQGEKFSKESKEVQTDPEPKSQDCICKKAQVENEVIMERDKIICVFKRIQCSEEEWQDVEETVRDSGIDLAEMLIDWAKVMEGYYRVGNSDE